MLNRRTIIKAVAVSAVLGVAAANTAVNNGVVTIGSGGCEGYGVDGKCFGCVDKVVNINGNGCTCGDGSPCLPIEEVEAIRASAVAPVADAAGDSTAPEQEPDSMLGGNGLCADPGSLPPGSEMAGGYSPVDFEEDGVSDEVNSAARAAALQFFNEDESKCYEEVIAACGATAESFADSVQVTAACSQVVAGTNYKVAFTTTIPCDDANKATLKDTSQLDQTFEADVFVPLPADNGGEGQNVEVTEITETGGTCTGVKDAPSPSPSTPSAPTPSPSTPSPSTPSPSTPSPSTPSPSTPAPPSSAGIASVLGTGIAIGIAMI
jgi:hypothetical protein